MATKAERTAKDKFWNKKAVAAKTTKIEASFPRSFQPNTSLYTLNAFVTTEIARIAISDADCHGHVLVQPHRDGYYVILEAGVPMSGGRYCVQTCHRAYAAALAAALTHVKAVR